MLYKIAAIDEKNIFIAINMGDREGFLPSSFNIHIKTTVQG